MKSVHDQDARLTLRKYRSSRVSLRSIVPARKMSTRHIRVASERRNGAAMQQTRPSWTMLVDGDQVVVVSEANVSARGQADIGENCFVDTRQGEYIRDF